MIEAAEDLVRRAGKRVMGIGAGVTPDCAIAQSSNPKLGYVPDGTGVHPDQRGGFIYSFRELNSTAEPPGSGDAARRARPAALSRRSPRCAPRRRLMGRASWAARASGGP